MNRAQQTHGVVVALILRIQVHFLRGACTGDENWHKTALLFFAKVKTKLFGHGKDRDGFSMSEGLSEQPAIPGRLFAGAGKRRWGVPYWFVFRIAVSTGIDDSD